MKALEGARSLVTTCATAQQSRMNGVLAVAFIYAQENWRREGWVPNSQGIRKQHSTQI